ncbi:PspC domain-containing protein [Ferrimonas senticii]|uniref:PspC domain-containing protein n=1 Tax=Ferrimonas senticii TaxID=394566 RepID=UPI0004265326|nr:PspC domain-containing protein [Ferrimonas senticii]
MNTLIPEAWLYGVVAGLSHRLGWNVYGCRAGWLLLAYFYPVKMLLAYLIALWLMPKVRRGQ